MKNLLVFLLMVICLYGQPDWQPNTSNCISTDNIFMKVSKNVNAELTTSYPPVSGYAKVLVVCISLTNDTSDTVP
jgi:hypothetical protein